jgi:hypothetical protein
MSLLKTLLELDDNGKVGDWCFVTLKNGQLNIFIRYPLGDSGDLPIEMQKGDIVRIPLNQPEGVSEKPWQWNGNRESPTVSPSILINCGDGKGGRQELWHGWLRDGKLVTA